MNTQPPATVAPHFDWNVFLFKLKTTATSIKFYSLIASLVVDYFAVTNKSIPVEQGVLLAIGALSIFSTGQAIEGIGKQSPQQPGTPVTPPQ